MLLDLFKNGTGDADRDAAIRQGLLAAGLQLMASRGKLFPALGQAGLQGMQASRQAMGDFQRQRLGGIQEQMLRFQRDAAQRENAIAQLPQASMVKPEFMDNRDVGQPGEAAPMFDREVYMQRLQQLASPLRVAQERAALYPKPARDFKVVGNSLVEIPEQGAPREAFTAPQSDTAVYQNFLKARAGGYRGDFMQYQTDLNASGASNISFGAPLPAINPKTGQAEFVRPDNKGGMTFTGVVPPPQNRDTKLPAELQRMQIAGDAMSSLMNDYERMLKANNPRDPLVQMNPTVRADMQALKRNIELQFKELQALGALAGPDIDIIRQSLSDPFTFAGAYYGRDGLLAQVKRARDLVRVRAEAVQKQHPAAAAPAGGVPAVPPADAIDAELRRRGVIK